MKLNELIKSFSIAMSNEESEVLNRIDGVQPLESFSEREQFVIEGLIRKSLVSKVHTKGSILVMVNEIK